jgi:hypothetical protein
MIIKLNNVEYTSLGRAITTFSDEVPDDTEVLYTKIIDEDESVQLQVIGLMYKEFIEDKAFFKMNYSDNDFVVFEKNEKEIGRILHQYYDINWEGVSGDYFVDLPDYFQGETPIDSEDEEEESVGNELVFAEGTKINFVSDCDCWDEIADDYFVRSEKYEKLSEDISELMDLINQNNLN